MIRLLAALLLLGAPDAKKVDKPKKKPALDLSMPDLGELPKADGLKTHVDQPAEDKPSAPAVAKYEVVRVVHANALVARGESYDIKGAVSRIDVTNLPTTVPGFQSLVRVRCNERLGAPIEVKLTEPGGHIVLQSEGNLVYSGRSETEYMVAWDPFTVSRAGAYTFEVVVNGQSISKTPFPVVQHLTAELHEAPVEAADGGS